MPACVRLESRSCFATLAAAEAALEVQRSFRFAPARWAGVGVILNCALGFTVTPTSDHGPPGRS
jgi:hypothetical protein